MGGFFNLFKNVKRAADAEAQKKADSIDQQYSTDFAKQDITKMESDLASVRGNIGTIKGEMSVLKEKIKDIEAQITKHDADATALAEKNPGLAEKHCAAAENLERQLEPLKLALQTQENLLVDQTKAKDDLASTLDRAKADLITLKAMNDAAKANENLIKINTGSGTSALAEFEKRKEEAKKRLIKSQALREESNPSDSLAAETAAALGTSGASARLARLKTGQK